MENISSWFWNERFWLPEGVSFNDFKSNDEETYAQVIDLYALGVYGLIVFVLRHSFEKYISNPFARMVLRDDIAKAENYFHINNNSNASNGHVNGIGNGKIVHKPLTLKRKQRKMNQVTRTIAKIAETSWKSIYHSFSFTFGLCLLLKAPWFWDTRHCWIDYPRHPLWPSLYAYYMIEGAYYIALLLCLATDVKRKDHQMMVVHHVGTICLIVFSYALNQTRLGSLLMVLHRFADMLLQISKLLLYCKLKSVAHYLFLIFVLSFVVTRLLIYPIFIMHTALFKVTWYFRIHPWYYFGNSLIVGLFFLHALWAQIILKMAYRVVFKSPLEKDDRSASEDESSDEEQASKAKKKV